LGSLKQEDHEFEARLDYIIRPYLQRKNKRVLLDETVTSLTGSFYHSPYTITYNP
jgi:hypothetical protein